MMNDVFARPPKKNNLFKTSFVTSTNIFSEVLTDIGVLFELQTDVKTGCTFGVD